MVFDLGIIKRQRYVEPTFIATGGTVVNVSDYVYHTFTTSSIFIPVYNVNADCLIVGGGGAGSDIAGGGAGGYRSLTINFQKNNAFSITIGQGGTTATTTGYESSIIGNNVNYVASGGGNAGQSGGSGGGGTGAPGSGAAGNTPFTSPSQGNDGGDIGGGGAGSAGSGSIGGNGAFWLNGNSYAGGGSGGGGASSGGGNNSSGTPNSGGGGSIGNFSGGSGIVIIRYRKYTASTPPAFDTSFAYNSLLLSNQSTSIDFSTGTINMLLIGGGGGGGGGGTYSSVNYVGGGGGAGGLYTNTFSPTLSTTLVVTIGAGGTGVDINTRFGTTGTSSTIRGKQPLGGDTAQTITATGGGAGQSYSYAGAYTSSSALANGGSGGGSPGGSAGSSTLSQNDGPNYYGHAGYVGGAGAYVAQGGGAGGSGGSPYNGSGKYVNIGNSSTFSTTFAIGGGGTGSGSAAGAIGGGGGSGSGGTGYTGGAGLAFFWHLSSLPIAAVGSTNAYSISFQNGYTIYAFINGSGTITFGPQWGNDYLKDSSPSGNPVNGFGNMLAQGSFNPYSTNWSTYFNGTTDYLSIQHSDAFNINSDFTLETWIYPTTSTDATIITKSITSEFSPFQIKIVSGNIVTSATYEYLSTYAAFFNGTTGSGQYLKFSGSSRYDIRTNNFTLECWFKVTTHTASGQIVGMRGATYQYCPVSLTNNGGKLALLSSSNGSSWNVADYATSTPDTQFTLSLNTWYHAAVVRNGTSLKVYLNGVAGVTRTLSAGQDYTQTNPPIYIGANDYLYASPGSGDPFNGYVSNVRFVQGVAVYTGNFTPPTSPLTAIANTSLLTLQNTTIVDNAYANSYAMIGTVTTSTLINFFQNNQNIVLGQINTNTWNHVSLSRSGSTYTSMLNGGTQITNTGTLYNNTQTIYIGYNGTNYFQGYISNLRFLNGSSVNVMPRLPFSLINNTTLLVSASGLLIDKSDYNFNVTQNGTPAIRRFSPFVNSGPYNTLISGGSIYFNGDSDFMTVPSNAVNFQNNSFNIEFWSYPEPIDSTVYFIDSRYNNSNSLAFGTATTSTNDGISMALLTSGLCTVNIGTATTFTSNDVESLRIKFRAWNHIALVRNNTTATLYINGNNAGSISTSVTVNTVVRSLYTAVSPNFPLVTNNFSIGRSSFLSSGYYKGYLSNLRILKGAISERVTTVVPSVGNSIEYLIVGAGGGGLGNGVYGGGGGGFRYGSFITTVPGASYTITIGSGGSLNGGNSSITGGGISIESAGGGSYSVSSGNGGSGSGGYGTGNTPSTSPSQGNDGGAYGGGGASTPGSGYNGGTGSTSTFTGSSLMYSGGGGGNITNSSGSAIGGSGGAGGGGAGWAFLKFDYLVLGGGGGGGSGWGGGGGGAGGFNAGTFIATQTNVTYVITAGAGGPGGSAGGSGTSGGTSSILGGGLNVTATGGGGGYAGASGGGSQGYPLGYGPGSSGTRQSGGGGGAGGSGSGATGGIGAVWSGDGVRYAGGGGAGGQMFSGGNTAGAGGSGLGGSGGYILGGAGSGGSIASGGGGGANQDGGYGGAGLIVIRYAGAGVASGGTLSTSSGYTFHYFYGSGTFNFIDNIFGYGNTTGLGTPGIRGNAGNGGTNTGGGGGGGGNGGSGMVAIRYTGPPRGLGGNITTNIYGSYTIHTFLSSSVYVDSKVVYTLPSAPVTTDRLQLSDFPVNYFVVAGGGAGGNSSGYVGGGGGGGGITSGTFTATVLSGLITITVGSGGATVGQNGNDSQIAGLNIPPNLLAKGGGGGGIAAGIAGGSGGGGGNATGSAGGAATQSTAGINGSGAGYGNAGAGGTYTQGLGTVKGGGGGGAGGAGYGAGGDNGGGAGGAGLTVNIFNIISGVFSNGGDLGGATVGGTGTGAGGGGGNASTTGKTGGSGVVVLWHLDTLSTPVTLTSASGSVTTSGYKVYWFYSSGNIEFKYANTSLLINNVENKIFDATAQNNIYAIGDVSISNSIIRYNNSSIYFDGDSDGLGIGSTSTTTATNLTALGSGDFTVEMWMYPLSLYNFGTAPALLDSRTTSTSVPGSAYLGFTGVNLGGGGQIGWKDDTTFVTTGTVIINAWNHVAVVRSGSTLSMYLSGVVTSSTINTTNYTIPFKYIGISYNSLSFKGYIDDLRITQNARYTSNFQPPLSAPQLK